MPDTVIVQQTVQQVTVQPVEQRVVVSTPGPQGPAGATGPAGAPGGSYFEAQFTNAAVIPVAHSLGFYPHTTVILSDGGDTMADVQHADANNLTVSFLTPQTGRVRCS